MAEDFYCPKCCRRRLLSQKSKRKVGRVFACVFCDEQIKARIEAANKRETEKRMTVCQ